MSDDLASGVDWGSVCGEVDNQEAPANGEGLGERRAKVGLGDNAPALEQFCNLGGGRVASLVLVTDIASGIATLECPRGERREQLVPPERQTATAVVPAGRRTRTKAKIACTVPEPIASIAVRPGSGQLAAST